MTYDAHSLAAENLVSWATALLAAVRLYWAFALAWFLTTLDPWEGIVVMLPSLVALIANALLLLRSRWHVRRMRGCVDGLKVRR